MDNAPDASTHSQPMRLARYPIPGYLMITYALLFIALGWFSHQRWGSPASLAAQTVPLPIIKEPSPVESMPITPDESANAPAVAEKMLPAIHDGDIPPLAYSAHVYTSDQAKRSITLNGLQFREGDTPLEGLTIEQIQQDVTIFNAEGEIFVLGALEDWPGGKFNEK